MHRAPRCITTCVHLHLGASRWLAHRAPPCTECIACAKHPHRDASTSDCARVHGAAPVVTRRLGPAQVAVLDMHQLALKVASASRARLVGHVRPPRLPFPTSDGPPGGRWRSGFASTRLHAPAQPHTESPRSMRLNGALLERTRDAPPSLYPLTYKMLTRPAAAGCCTSTGPEAVSRIPPVARIRRSSCIRLLFERERREEGTKCVQYI